MIAVAFLPSARPLPFAVEVGEGVAAEEEAAGHGVMGEGGMGEGGGGMTLTCCLSWRLRRKSWS